ncbi:TetR/AcrR family transcriptional regulator [Amycolatopsis minnesotensis]|uniref:TetR/AcrR family transcriptional regulator n=1 Tax=Amycolatopsis minnesotensis TaxID=337894 RepID=A0ABP5DYZ3_9PSEU
MSKTLSKSEQRRSSVIAAAVEVFAKSGYRATPVAEVAAAAEISPAYVFRLFPTKQDLFVAATSACFDRIIDTLRAAVDQLPAASPGRVLAAMAEAYAALITDRKLIMLQVHALAASDEPAIRDALCGGQARLVDYVAGRSRAAQPDVQAFFARGQLCHLVATLGIEDSAAGWALQLTEGLVHYTDATG